MILFSGNKTTLRPVSDGDLDQIMEWENNPDLWSVSEDPGPFSREKLASFISNSQQLERDGQLRLMIQNEEGDPIGSLDICDYEPTSKTAAIGILIADENDRKKGYASDALQATLTYYRKEKSVRVFRCLVYYDNAASLALFRKNKFTELTDRMYKGKIARQFIFELKPLSA